METFTKSQDSLGTEFSNALVVKSNTDIIADINIIASLNKF